MADETNPEGSAPAPAPAAAHAAKPAAPKPPAAPLPDLAGKTTTAASAGGAQAKAAAAAPAATKPAVAAGRDPDDSSPLLNRRAWLGLARILRRRPPRWPRLARVPERPQLGSSGRLPSGRHGRGRAVQGQITRPWIVRTGRPRATAAGFYALISVCRIWAARRTTCRPRASSSAPVTAAFPHGRELRRAGAASARARARRVKRADSRGQGKHYQRAGPVDRSESFLKA
jgi:hypothetical protein